MSIFSNVNDLEKLNDEIISRYYNLEWDWIEGKKIKHRLAKKIDTPIDKVPRLYENTYYYPLWVFKTLYANVISDVRHNGKEISGKNVNIVLSKLDLSNMRHRFNKIIEQCGKFEYMGETFINIAYHDVRVDSVRKQITNMMYDYISKETCNSKYFKKKK